MAKHPFTLWLQYKIDVVSCVYLLPRKRLKKRRFVVYRNSLLIDKIMAKIGIDKNIEYLIIIV